MTLRRGFKSEANRTALEVRTELGLTPSSRLDPLKLAEHLDVEVAPLSQLMSRAPHGVALLLGRGKESFSAITVFRGSTRAIWHNDSHSFGRQSSNVAHELAHALLLHAPGLIVQGKRDWNPTQEEEAAWLGGTLLVPDEAAVLVARSGTAVTVAAAQYGVSDELMLWRLQVSGAFIRARRRAERTMSPA